MDLDVPVADPSDLMDTKIAAAMEPTRRRSKRQKDLADIMRLVDAFPELESRVPDELRRRMFF
jgi:hypothetical protein